jgi:hypothetical protein
MLDMLEHEVNSVVILKSYYGFDGTSYAFISGDDHSRASGSFARQNIILHRPFVNHIIKVECIRFNEASSTAMKSKSIKAPITRNKNRHKTDPTECMRLFL